MSKPIWEITRRCQTKNDADIFWFLSWAAVDGVAEASRAEIAHIGLDQPQRKSTSELVNSLKRLEQAGLIEKVKGSRTRRNRYRILVTPTQKGVEEWLTGLKE